MSARPRPMSPYACDYGAGGAALFDIVNVQNWTRRQARRIHKVASTPGAAPRSFANFPRAGLGHRAEHSPRKREAGGSSPPASATVMAAIIQWQGTALVRREPAFDPPLRHHQRTLGMHSWRNGRRSRFRSGLRKAWRFKSSRVHHLFARSRDTDRFAERPRHRPGGLLLSLLLLPHGIEPRSSS